MKKLILLGSLAVVIILAGCRPSTKTITNENKQLFENYVLVTADGGYQLTAIDIYNKMYSSRMLTNGGIVDSAEVHRFVDSLVIDSIISLEAQGVKLDNDYEKRKLFYLRYNDMLIRKYIDLNVYSKVQVDSTEAVKFYYDNPDLFKIEETINLYHIYITSEGLLKSPDSMIYKPMTEAQLDSATEAYTFNVYNKIVDFESFKNMANEYSHDNSTIYPNGYVGWTTRGQYVDPFDSIAFALNEGEFSKPYKDNNGWHILYCATHFYPGLQDLNPPLYESAVNTLKTKKANALGQALFDSLFADYDVNVNDSLMDKDVFAYPGRLWIANVNGIDTIDINEVMTLEKSARKKLGVQVTNPQQKLEYLRYLGQKYVLLQTARHDKVDTLPDIVSEAHNMYQKYGRQLLDRLPYDFSWTPTDSMIEAYYNAHLDEFKPAKPLEVQQIITQDSVFGEFIRDQAMSGIDFLDLAEEYYPGEQKIRRELANLGAIAPGDVDTVFYQAALMLQPGGVSHPVKTEYGYHIIKLIKKHTILTVSQARSQIVQKLKEAYRTKLFNDYRNDMYAKYHVQYKKKPVAIHLKPLKTRLDEPIEQK